MIRPEDLKGTQSEKNVRSAFATEAQAICRYTYYAELSRQAGFEEIAQLFETMARNEQEHARQWFRLMGEGLEGGVVEFLKQSAGRENSEWKNFYPAFARQARKDGFEMLGVLFDKVAAIENDHEKRFLEARLAFAEDGSGTISRPEDDAPSQRYRCLFCGDVENQELKTCPVCGAPDSFRSAYN